MYKSGHKPMKKNWSASEIDQTTEEKKAMLILSVIFVSLIALAFFMFWIKRTLK